MFFLPLSVKGSQFSVCYIKFTRQSNWKSTHSDIRHKNKSITSEIISSKNKFSKVFIFENLECFPYKKTTSFNVLIPLIFITSHHHHHHYQENRSPLSPSFTSRLSLKLPNSPKFASRCSRRYFSCYFNIDAKFIIIPNNLDLYI